jgi:uncharacterized membrane protein YfcA
LAEFLTQLSPLVLVVLFGAGLLSGIINTVGGGGSVVTLPALIFAGLPASVANATNRIGIIAQNAAGIHQFRGYKIREDHLSWRLMLVAAVGAVLGARLAAYIDDSQFEVILGFVMLGLLVLMLTRPKPHLTKSGSPEDAWSPLSMGKRVGLLASFFGLGIYAGFIQAGMGIMVLLILGYYLRMDLVRGNYIKMVVILGLSLIALVTFVSSGVRVDWLAGIVCASGQILGAWIGAWIATRGGERWIVIIMAVVILLSSAKLLGVLRPLEAMIGLPG